MDVEVGSGNVIADLGLPNAVDLDLKVRSAVEIVRSIEARWISADEIARILKVSHADIALLKNYKLDTFSVDRLKAILRQLRKHVPSGHRKCPPSSKN